MWQLPMHPVLVHFPIVLAFLVPPVALFVAWGIFSGKAEHKRWLLPVSLQAAVFLFALAAVQLGQRDEERVEALVSEQLLENHEEWGEQFQILSGGLLLLMLVPFAIRTRFLPPILAVLTLAGTAIVIQVGHTGGELVYGSNGLFNASVSAPGGESGPGNKTTHSARHDDDDDDDDD